MRPCHLYVLAAACLAALALGVSGRSALLPSSSGGGAGSTRPARRTWAAIFPGHIVVFAVLFAAYMHEFVDPRLVLFCQGHAAAMTPDAGGAAQSPLLPGDPVAHLGGLLMQAYAHRVLGAVVAAMLVLLVLAGTAALASSVAPGMARGAWVVPAVLLVILNSQYAYPISATLEAIVAIAAINIYTRVRIQGVPARLATVAAVSLVLYYLAPGASVIFWSCAVVYELTARPRPLLAAPALVIAPALVLGMEFTIFRPSWGDLFSRMLPLAGLDSPWLLLAAIGLWVYFPIYVAMAGGQGRALAAASAFIAGLWRRPDSAGRNHRRLNGGRK